MELRIDKDLGKILDDILENEKYYNDINLINYLSSAFATKGLPRDIPNKLFMELTTLGQLTEIELIFLVQTLYDYKVKGERIFKDLEPKEWFSDNKIKDVYEYVNKEEIYDTIILNNVDKLSDYQYICTFCSVNDIAKYRKDELFSYNFKTQREPKFRPIGTEGAVAKEIFTNPKSVKAISELIYENSFTPNMLTLNVPLIDGKSPNVIYDKSKRTMVIKPNYDTSAEDYTTVNVVDGWHRISGAYDAVERAKKEGKELVNGFVLSINLMTPDEAEFHFERENRYNPISENYLSTFEVSDTSKFIKTMVNYSKEDNIFKNNVSRTYEETKAYKKLTYYKVLEDGVKQTDIDVKNILSQKYTISKIVKFITEFIKYAKSNKDFNEDLLSINVFIGYLVIASRIKSDDEIADYIESLYIALDDEKVKNDLKEMGLNNKHYSAKKIADYFNELF